MSVDVALQDLTLFTGPCVTTSREATLSACVMNR